MEAFLKRKARDESPHSERHGDEDEPTELKLALLCSMHPQFSQETLLDILLAHDGSVTSASAALQTRSTRKTSGVIGYQQSLRHYAIPTTTSSGAISPSKKKLKSKKGSTLHLYDPKDVAEHTPCTIVHNFLPSEDANELLKELLDEAKSFEKITFKLFENVVQSPHTSSFYVESLDEVHSQKTDYHYNGSKLIVCFYLLGPALVSGKGLSKDYNCV